MYGECARRNVILVQCHVKRTGHSKYGRNLIHAVIVILVLRKNSEFSPPAQCSNYQAMICTGFYLVHTWVPVTVMHPDSCGVNVGAIVPDKSIQRLGTNPSDLAEIKVQTAWSSSPDANALSTDAPEASPIRDYSACRSCFAPPCDILKKYHSSRRFV